MINYDDILKQNKNKHNTWPRVPDNPYGILMTKGAKSKK